MKAQSNVLLRVSICLIQYHSEVTIIKDAMTSLCEQRIWVQVPPVALRTVSYAVGCGIGDCNIVSYAVMYCTVLLRMQ
jgi:hypothetical protein